MLCSHINYIVRMPQATSASFSYPSPDAAIEHGWLDDAQSSGVQGCRAPCRENYAVGLEAWAGRK